MSKTNTPSILITGATGNIGRELTRSLSAQNIPFRAMVRSAKGVETVGALGCSEAVIGDFDDLESLARAIEGIQRAFLLTNSSEYAEAQQSTFVDVAQRAGVKHIVKLSQWAADADSPVRFLRYHAVVERHIKESGMAYTFLRPNLFMQGLLTFREPIMAQGKFFAAAGTAQISAIDVRDIAAAAVAALTEDGHEGKAYDLTGPEALSHGEMAEKLSQALQRQVEYVDVPETTMKEALLSFGIPLWQADGIVEDYAHYRRGEASTIASGVQDATGTPPRSFDSFARDYAAAFS